MNKVPHDYDITVDALPEEISNIFISHGFSTSEKGHKFGTIAVQLHNDEIEITPHRTESNYTDARHPEKVEFVRDLTLDLSRRDFTVNAIAMDLSGNIVDPFGGCVDIQKCILRCVGDPYIRFSEDALRILRAIRFAARFGFKIEENTRRAMSQNADLISRISAERICTELSETLSYPHSFEIFNNCIDVIRCIIPFFVPHKFLMSEKGDTVEKLYSCICNENYETVSDLCEYLKLRSDESDKIRKMQLLYNDILTRDGNTVIFDNTAKKAFCDYPADYVRAVFEFSDSVCDELHDFIENGIYTNSKLAISGGDIVSLGLFPKPMTAKILHKVLYEVACDRVKNSKNDILNYLLQL